VALKVHLVLLVDALLLLFAVVRQNLLGSL
jgi:hypothetical protein